jgi:hypothetical protein
MTLFGIRPIRYPYLGPREGVRAPEPEELEGSELSDAERRQAIARERARREGLT